MLRANGDQIMGLMTSAYRRVEPARLDQRAAVRHPVMIRRASVRRHGREPIEAELDDLSVYGCRLAVDALFEAGDRLSLRFAAGQSIAASAIWYECGKLGCRFDEQLDRALFRSLTLVFD
jgi:PilZ domain